MMNKVTIEVFQTDGYDATLRQAEAEFLSCNPDVKIHDIKFSYAYPGNPGEGRWVGIEVTFS